MPLIQVIRADITTLDVDAIVNAANAELIPGGGVDGAIHWAAGPALEEACRRIGGCPTGQAVMTPGYALPARYVIHTVGPIWEGGDAGEDDLLASCYRSCLALARTHQLRSVAFSAISTGVYGFPVARAAEIAVGTVRGALADHPDPPQVLLVCFNQDVMDAFSAALAQAAR